MGAKARPTSDVLDMPGMGWSDITKAASYTELALRRAVVDFVAALDITGVTLAGESMGATVSLTASTALEGRVRRIVAFNPCDYPRGVARANRVVSIYIGGARLPVFGSVVTRMENEPVLGIVSAAASSMGASCRITTSPSCVGRVAVGGIRVWRARSTSTWTA